MALGRASGANQIDWQSLSAHLEALIISGNHGACRDQIKRIARKSIPRDFVALIAEIAWRASEPLFALKILHPILFPENRFQKPASPKEKVIYGTSLSSLGATFQATRLLESVDGDQEPAALLHLAITQMSSWNYKAAVAPLKRYIQSQTIPAYRRLVGRVNLAAVMIHLEDWSEASNLLNTIESECKANSYGLLLGNCFELKAQIAIFNRKFDEALNYLDQSQHFLKSQGGTYSLFTDKWVAICHCLMSTSDIDRQQAIEKLNRIRKQAVRVKHWNTLRECDLFEAITNNDHELVKKVMMGTPSAQYRQRVRRLFKPQSVSLENFYYTLGATDVLRDDINEFDPRQRTSTGETLYSKPLLLSLFQALTLDFYQPQTLAMIFQNIYPGENFNPFNSQLRVLQLLRRLNAWFIDNGLTLRINFIKSEFQLSSTEITKVVLERRKSATAYEFKFIELKNQFCGKRFSVIEVCEALKVSKSTAERLIRQALAGGMLSKERKPRGVAYRFASAIKKKQVA